MLTSLDLLVIVFMVLAVLTLLAVSLMFLIRNKIAKYVFFCITTVLGLFVSLIAFLIGFSGFFQIQMAVSLLTAVVGIGAVVLAIVGRKHKALFLIARLASIAVLVVGFFNAFVF